MAEPAQNRFSTYSVPTVFARNGRFGRSMFISLIGHVVILAMLYFFAVRSAKMKPPQKVYAVKIIPYLPSLPEKRKKVELTERIVKKKKRIKKKPKKPKKPEKKTIRSKSLPRGSAKVRLEGEKFTDDFYLNLIISKIGSNWINPVRGGKRLSTVIYFKIARDGTIFDAKVEKKSGSLLFDQAALRAVLVSSPMPPLPDSYSGDHLGVHFEFEHIGR